MLIKRHARIHVRAVIHRQHDHRSDFRPECLRSAAPFKCFRHPSHGAVAAQFDETLKLVGRRAKAAGRGDT